MTLEDGQIWILEWTRIVDLGRKQKVVVKYRLTWRSGVTTQDSRPLGDDRDPSFPPSRLINPRQRVTQSSKGIFPGTRRDHLLPSSATSTPGLPMIGDGIARKHQSDTSRVRWMLLSGAMAFTAFRFTSSSRQ